MYKIGETYLLEGARLRLPDISEIRQWLVEHYSNKRKLPADRIALLLAVKNKFELLQPPNVKYIYRGLFNITLKTAQSIYDNDLTDSVIDKSWTLSYDVAKKFAIGEFTKEKIIDERYGMILKGIMPENALLNWRLASIEPDIGNVWNHIWNEPLALSIRSEREVIVGEAVEIDDAKIIKL